MRLWVQILLRAFFSLYLTSDVHLKQVFCGVVALLIFLVYKMDAQLCSLRQNKFNMHK